jgi:hypothetical protein
MVDQVVFSAVARPSTKKLSCPAPPLMKFDPRLRTY